MGSCESSVETLPYILFRLLTVMFTRFFKSILPNIVSSRSCSRKSANRVGLIS